jgi:hypothetical protein
MAMRMIALKYRIFNQFQSSVTLEMVNPTGNNFEKAKPIQGVTSTSMNVTAGSITRNGIFLIVSQADRFEYSRMKVNIKVAKTVAKN